MPVKILILAPIFYFLALLQSSFLPHFAVFGHVPDLVFIAIVFSFFFLPSLGWASAFWGGFFLDIFSSHFLGFNVTIALGLLFFIRYVMKKYVQITLR